MMERKDEKNVYRESCLAIIDDPISSFDIENKIGILSFVKFQLENYLLNNRFSKFILMTHDLKSFFDLCKIAGDLQKKIKKAYNLPEKTSVINIKELSEKKLKDISYRKRQEYTVLLENIYDYALSALPDLEVTIGNSMRRVLEAYSTFIYKNSIEEIANNSIILSDIDKETAEHFKFFSTRFVLNSESHLNENVRMLNFFEQISTSSKQKTAKYLICFIYSLNKNHILIHLSSRKNVSDNINNWLNEIKNCDLG